MSTKNIVYRRGNIIGFQTRSGEILYYEFSPAEALAISFGNDPKNYSGTRVNAPDLIGDIEDIAIEGIEDAAEAI